MEGNNAEELKNQLTQAKCEKAVNALGPKEYREKHPQEITYNGIGSTDIPYLQTNDYLHTMDLNHSGTRLVFSGTLLKCVTVNIEDGKIMDEHPEETMLFDVRFDQSDNIWYVCNDMEFKRYNFHTKKETFSHKDEKGSADTVKEINNMIQIDDTRAHVYCRVSNTKIVGFTCASNSMVDEFDNLTEEKDSSGQDMFIYFFKVAKRRIFYTESRRQHVKLYDMDSKNVLSTVDFKIWPQLIAISPDAGHVVICEDKKFILAEIKETEDGKTNIVEEANSDTIHEEWPLQIKFASFGAKGMKILSTSPDKALAITNMELKREHYFDEKAGNKLHDHWVNDVLWDEKQGMLISYGHDHKLSRIMFN